MIRLKDIALRASVSTMTVSKALRDADDIAATTKARVRQIAEELGYTPDTMARSLRSRTTRLLGLVISAATNPIFARVVMAIEEQAHEHGYDVLLAHTLNVAEREQAVIRRMLSRRVDGLFVYPVHRLEPTAPVYDALQKRGIPTVILGPVAPFCASFASVATDDRAASYALTKHLLDLGHTRIAFLSGPAVVPWCQERLDGYRAALREANVEIDDQLIFSAGNTIEEGEKAALQILNEAPKFTAVQAVNDLVAIGAANVFLNQGFRIPEHLSVVGFGNILVAEHFRVPLTTVRQPKLRLGAAAMESMLKLMRGERVENKRLAGEIIIRKSTAPPPAG